MRLTGRAERHVRLVEAYAKAQGLWHDARRELRFDETIELDLGESYRHSRARPGPRTGYPSIRASSFSRQPFGSDGRHDAELRTATVHFGNYDYEVGDGAVAIAAITSCTNTSNPEVMVAAGLLARKAVRAGLRSKPWVKTTLSPGPGSSWTTTPEPDWSGTSRRWASTSPVSAA